MLVDPRLEGKWVASFEKQKLGPPEYITITGCKLYSRGVTYALKRDPIATSKPGRPLLDHYYIRVEVEGGAAAACFLYHKTTRTGETRLLTWLEAAYIDRTNNCLSGNNGFSGTWLWLGPCDAEDVDADPVRAGVAD